MHFLLYELAENADVQEKLYTEVSKYLKDDEDVSYETLSKLCYLKHVVKENFRLHQLAPGNSRILTKDLILDDYLIPKGVNIVNIIFSEFYCL